MSAPFINQAFTFPQPDGSTIEVRGTGNQERATFETLDGVPLIRDAEGRWVEMPRPAVGLESLELDAGAEAEQISPLAKRKSRWQKRRRAARKTSGPTILEGIALAPPERQTTGNWVGLTVLVDFSDDPAAIPREEVERFCNQPGYSGFGNNGSVADYFRDVSGGKFTYTNVVLPYYRAKKPKSYYADLSLTAAKRKTEFTRRAQELIREAIKHHIGIGTNFGSLTSDSNAFIYALNVFYAGDCPNAWSEGLWPHQYTLATPIALPGGRKFADYQITDMGAQLTLGTFCHENGHMVCDFPDLYAYVKNYGNGAGVFCLMCSGANANPKNPVHVGAYLKNEAGWGTAKVATPGPVSLTAGSNDFLLHQLNPEEYFIVENRAKTGRDAALPGGGLAIWHVCEKGSNNRPQPGAHNHYECTLVQADGSTDIVQGTSSGKSGDLFFGPATFSRAWYGGAASNLSIDQIGPVGTTMTFRVR